MLQHELHVRYSRLAQKRQMNGGSIAFSLKTAVVFVANRAMMSLSQHLKTPIQYSLHSKYINIFEILIMHVGGQIQECVVKEIQATCSLVYPDMRRGAGNIS